MRQYIIIVNRRLKLPWSTKTLFILNLFINRLLARLDFNFSVKTFKNTQELDDWVRADNYMD